MLLEAKYVGSALAFLRCRRCIWRSIYLDRNGEEDRNMRRGRMLYLNAQRYAQLQNMVVENTFAHDTRILRSTSQRDGSRY